MSQWLVQHALPVIGVGSSGGFLVWLSRMLWKKIGQPFWVDFTMYRSAHGGGAQLVWKNPDDVQNDIREVEGVK